MRYWLAAGGINPEQEVSLIVVPPPQMVQNVKVGNMETFCVGEPWPAQTVTRNWLHSHHNWRTLERPSRALSMRADWVDKTPRQRRQF